MAAVETVCEHKTEPHELVMQNHSIHHILFNCLYNTVELSQDGFLSLNTDQSVLCLFGSG